MHKFLSPHRPNSDWYHRSVSLFSRLCPVLADAPACSLGISIFNLKDELTRFAQSQFAGLCCLGSCGSPALILLRTLHVLFFQIEMCSPCIVHSSTWFLLPGGQLAPSVFLKGRHVIALTDIKSWILILWIVLCTVQILTVWFQFPVAVKSNAWLHN